MHSSLMVVYLFGIASFVFNLQDSSKLENAIRETSIVKLHPDSSERIITKANTNKVDSTTITKSFKNDNQQAANVNPSSAEPWWVKLVYIAVGAILGFIGTISRDILSERRNKKSIREAMIAEIRVNSTTGLDESGNVVYTHPAMWITDVYKGNIAKIIYFTPEEISHLVQLYGMMNDFQAQFSNIPKEERSANTMKEMRRSAEGIRKSCREFLGEYR